jgi:uncharacterized protein (DUF736 family)
MIIGNFTYDAQSDTYTGNVTTLTLHRNSVQLRPVDKFGDREPDYRVVGETAVGIVEFGAAWKRKSEKGQDFLSVSIDDPGLAAALNAALFPDEDGETAVLAWNRKKTGKGEASEAPRPGNGTKSAKAKSK